MGEQRPKAVTTNQADELVAWLLEGAHELQNAHESGFTWPCPGRASERSLRHM